MFHPLLIMVAVSPIQYIWGVGIDEDSNIPVVPYDISLGYIIENYIYLTY